MPDTGSERGPVAEAERPVAAGSPPRAPRWAKVLAALALLLVLVAIVVLLAGGSGGHGPGRHSGDDATPTRGGAAARNATEGHAPSGGARHATR